MVGNASPSVVRTSLLSLRAARSRSFRSAIKALPPKPDDKATALYRAFAVDGCLLYVGIANTPASRLAQHASQSPWATRAVRVELEWFDDRRSAEIAERQTIGREKPLFNVQNSG